MRVAHKFEQFLNTYRCPDGRRWTGQDLCEATGGFVTRSYVSTLRKGKIANPGVDKLQAIARAMGFPPELWFTDASDPDAQPNAFRTEERWGLDRRLSYLFETIKDEQTGRPYSNAKVARMSLGVLTEEQVEGIKTGRDENPTVAQVLALAEVFGVDPSYFLNKGAKPPLLDEAAMRVLGDQKTRAIASKSLELSDSAKDLVIDMVERLGHLGHESGTP